jgi:thiosulfate/3-mercaptopyruvate sulfurtransferase
MNFRTVIDPSDLGKCLNLDSLVVLDCRFDLLEPEAGRSAWLAAHIPGARYVDLDRDLTGTLSQGTGRHPLPEADVMARRFGMMGVDENSQVVVYDDSNGAIASRAWWMLRWLGHDRVAVLDGGFSRWISLGYAVRDGEERAKPATLSPKPRRGLTLGVEELLAEPDAIETLRLVDARDAARFRGEHEPIDSVAGHIPGSRNLPFSDTLAPDGTLLSPEGLRHRLAHALDGDLDTPWSVMCGSGVTACQLALGAEHANVRAPRLYVGSFSEWIRDPARPVGRGRAAPARECADRSAT